MDDFAIARAVHVLAILHWIGGLAFVTLVILPAVARMPEPARRIAAFEEIEGRFSFQVKFSILLAGASGFYMTYRLDAWDRFADPDFWWMHAMVLLWTLFMVILFVAEPLFLRGWFLRRATANPEATFAFVRRGHGLLLTLSVITVAGAVLGSHGVIF